MNLRKYLRDGPVPTMLSRLCVPAGMWSPLIWSLPGETSLGASLEPTGAIRKVSLIQAFKYGSCYNLNGYICSISIMRTFPTFEKL